MRRCLPLWACLLLLTPAAPARAGPLAVANAAWPGSPCAGLVNVTFDETLYDRTGFVGGAAGIRVVTANGSWVRVSCKVLLDTQEWRFSTPRERCRILTHEAGHLAHGPLHVPGTIMAADHSGPFPPCDHLSAPAPRTLSATRGGHTPGGRPDAKRPYPNMSAGA